MENQPEQPTQTGQPTPPQPEQPMPQMSQMPQTSQDDFLSRMDAVTHPVEPEPEKKKMSKGALIGIVVGVLAVIGIGVGAVMMLISSGSQPTTTTTTGWDEPEEPEIDPEAEARNRKRANDLKVLGEAVKIYQAQEESEGQLPGADTEEWETVIKLYTPDGEILDGATGEKYEMGAICKFGESCVDIASLTWEENAHQVYALYNADCKGHTKENVIVSSTRLRRVAIFAIVEGDQFICTTN